MSCEEKGAYIQLLCYQWDNNLIPQEKPKLCRICGVNGDFDFSEILLKFPNGKNPTMEEIKLKTLEKSKQAKVSARRSVESRQRTLNERSTNVKTDVELSKSKSKSKDKSKDKDKAKLPAKAGTPQAEFVKNWSDLYQSETGKPFKADTKDFILVANLLTRFGEAEVFSRAKILFAACRDRSAWFAKGGMADFTIGKLSSHWNSLIKEVLESGKQAGVSRSELDEFMSGRK